MIEAVLTGGPADLSGFTAPGEYPPIELNVQIANAAALFDPPTGPAYHVARYRLWSWGGAGHFAFYEYAHTEEGPSD